MAPGFTRYRAATRRTITASLLALGACGARSGRPPEILLFNGTGASPGSVAAIARILSREDLSFVTANSRDLDGMDQERLGAHRLLIMPGGNFEIMGNALSPETSARIRSCVRGGLNYFGVCAGAFFAGASPYNGANLTDGVRFGFYSLSAGGIRKSVTPITMPDGTTLDHYWEDGPQLPGWGEPVAKYPDGAPAIAQGWIGKGWVILTGIHTEADNSWRGGMTFRTSAQVNNDHAATLIHAALDRRRLEHF